MHAQAKVLTLHSRVGGLWRNYSSALEAKPLQTKSLTCMAAYALGDVVAQLSTHPSPKLERRLLDLDALRSLRLALFGLLFVGPAGHNFYGWLEKAIMPSRPRHLVAICTKVAIDQMCYSPALYTVFFAWLNLATFNPGNIVPDIHSKLYSSCVASASLWVPAMMINMAFVPTQLRMLYINAVSLVWTQILSRMASEQQTGDPETLLLPTEPLELHEAVVLEPLFETVQEYVDPLREMVAQTSDDFANDWPLIDPFAQGVLDKVDSVRGAVVDFSTTHVLPFVEAADEFVTEVVDAVVEAIPVDTTMHDDHAIEVHAMSAFPGIGAVTSEQLRSDELPADN